LSSARFVVAILAILVALTIVPANADAGSGTQSLNGDQRYEVGGGSGPSIAYPNGIILSDLTNPGYAVWRFQIHGVPPAYNATVSVNYTESLGNGPTISLYNWALSAWDPIAIDVGTGLYRNYSVYVPSMSYVNASGSLYVNVSAEAAEFIDIGTVTVNWAYDDTPPSNPNSNLSTPSIDVWTRDNTVDVE